MPIYTGKFHPQGAPPPAVAPSALKNLGPIVQVQIEVPLALSQQLQAASQPIPQPVVGIALIDTGAGVSAVDQNVPGKLGVSPVGTVPVGSAGGQRNHNVYPMRIILPGILTADYQQLIDADLAPHNLVALLGRDFLERVLLIYDGPNGEFRISF